MSDELIRKIGRATGVAVVFLFFLVVVVGLVAALGLFFGEAVDAWGLGGC